MMWFSESPDLRYVMICAIYGSSAAAWSVGINASVPALSRCGTAETPETAAATGERNGSGPGLRWIGIAILICRSLVLWADRNADYRCPETPGCGFLADQNIRRGAYKSV